MNHTPHPIVVGVNLEGDIAAALDQAAAEAMMSRAGYVRRVLVEGLRASEHLPELPTGPRQAARYRAIRP